MQFSWLNSSIFIRNGKRKGSAPTQTAPISRPLQAYIHSLEGDIYLLEIVRNGVSEWVESGRSGKVKRFTCLSQTKRHAKALGITEIRLALETPYDEMIGLASNS